jgi:hypothetical protein
MIKIIGEDLFLDKNTNTQNSQVKVLLLLPMKAASRKGEGVWKPHG